MDEAFIMARSEERKTCRVGATAIELNCADLVARDPCIGDPFYSTCDPEEYKAERTARELYCLSGVVGGIAFGEGIPLASSSINNVDRLCGTFRIPICSWDGVSEVSGRLNPTADVCPSGAAGTLIQIVYCTIGNNWNNPAIRPGCNTANDTFGGCIENPFKTTSITDSRSVCTTNPAQFGLAALANRVKFCSGDVDIDDPAQLALCVVAGQPDTQDMLCASSGVHANPFVNLCVREGTDFDAVRAGFLASCKTSNTFAPACPAVLVCDTDPYGADCVDKIVYSPSRQPIVNECEMLGAETSDSRCTTAIKDCIATPYGDDCKDNPDYTTVRANFLNACGDSDSVRGGAEETKCRPAFDTFCTGDNLFTDTGANCLGDDDYKTARDTHFAECQKATSARVGTDCDLASAQICAGTKAFYTDPFAPLCDEDGRSSLLARQAVIKRCEDIIESERGDMGNESCETGGAFDILNDCGDDPVIGKCADYIGTESAKGAYFDARASRLSDCAAEEGPTNHQSTCTGAIEVLCTAVNADSAPFGPVCDDVFNIHVIRGGFLFACNAGGSPADCNNSISTAVKMACDTDPYDSAVPTIGTASVDCNDFSLYSTPRETRLTGCSNGTIQVRCQSVKARVCRADGANANPFNTFLCTGGGYAIEQRDFCQIRANVGHVECISGALTRATTATLLAGQTTEFNAAPDETNRKNEFLKGTDNGVDIGGLVQQDGNPLTVFTLDLANNGYNNVLFGGEAADGLAFFAGRPTGGSNTPPHFYGAIFAGTDLGKPLKQETGLMIDWYGRASWIVVGAGAEATTGHAPLVTVDFILKVNLETRTLDAHMESTDRGPRLGFTIAASYDTKGVISGNVSGGQDVGVKYGVSTGTTLSPAYFSTGKITGLIGEQGAVAVFSAYAGVDSTEASVGGFVARAPRPDFFNWSRTTSSVLISAGAGDGMARFILGGTEALDVGAGGVPYTLTLADDYSKGNGDIVTLGGEVADGVSFAVNGARLYSGLLAGTDVGVPLIANANYQGRIGILIHKNGETTYDVDNEFTLNANFGPGTFNDGFASLGGLAFTISGGKFNQFGLISGTVNLGTSSGTLSGLIGTEGVVGSFISTTHTDGAFAGGFVAHTAFTDLAPRARTTPIWRDNAVTDDGTDLDVLAGGNAVESLNPLTNFIVGGGTALGLSGAQNITQKTLKADESYTDSRGDMVRLDGDSRHGVAFARATILSENKWYAGLLSGTSLGNPVSHTAATADWVGQVGLIKDGINSGNAYTAPLVLTVNFKERKISSRAIAIFADTLTIDGRYDGHGLIRGTVSYATPTQTGVGHLTGLIGAGISSGAATAVGAFISGASGDDVGGYAGGFVAREVAGVTTTSRKVVFGDWTYSFGDTPPPAKLDTATRRNQFLAGGQEQLNAEGAINAQQQTISAATGLATFDGIDLGLGHNHGMSYFGDRVNNVRYFYAGVLEDTDLGAPVGLMFNNQPTGRWNGKFGYRAPVGGDRDFTLEIDFTNSMIEAFVLGRDGNYFHLNGGYDANGAIINGTVDYGAFNAGTRTPTATRTPNGTLTGIIGEKGAVGAFISDVTGFAGYAGGFVAVPTAVDRVRFIDWTRSFDTLPETAPSTTFQNQFLQGTADNITATAVGLWAEDDETGMIAPTLLTLGTTLGVSGDTKNGVGFFRGFDSAGTDYFYAGIFNGADLGAPLTSDTAAGVWKGKFQVVSGGGGNVDTDFTLEVTFGAVSGFSEFAGTVEAFVDYSDGFSYHLEGNYDRNGVISGKVDFGQFNTGTRVQTSTEGRIGATVRGLIGQAGAIGVFVNDATTLDGYAGGFVACKRNTDDTACQ